MKFLVIEQDLRVSGTSQGIISRSFLAKLRKSYPVSQIDVVYLRRHRSDDQLDLLPVNSIEVHVIETKLPITTKWINKIYWRIFHKSLRERHIIKEYASVIKKINYQSYDHIFIRSAGLDHEVILASKNLPILKRAIVNFHDPYPVFWYAGAKSALTNLELFRLKEMEAVVSQSKICMSSAYTMSRDMEYLYGSRKHFYTLPHQYAEEAFDLTDVSMIQKKRKEITISYHGAIQFGRDIYALLDAYEELLKEKVEFQKFTELVLRLKGIDINALRKRYSCDNVIILDTLNFSNSAYEQKYEADINVILENGPIYSNILVGKAPFLSFIKKPVLCLSPERSELRHTIKEDQYIASYSDLQEIKIKLIKLVSERLRTKEPVFPFGNYFDDDRFKEKLDIILDNSKG